MADASGTRRRYHFDRQRYDLEMVTTAVMIGAGQRGYYTFGAYAAAHPDELKFVAVIDPDPQRRARFIAVHRAADEFSDVAGWLGAGRLADVAIIASPDRFHHEAAGGALRIGYDVLLEKPMAATLADSVDLVRTAEACGRTLAVAHVLRHTPFFATLHEVVTSGRLGEIITVTHRENVSAFHMAHSFVRGNWAQSATSTPMVVQKCCHDFDILAWNLESPVVRMSSVGSLMHFRPEKSPAAATPRCDDPCPIADCPFDARCYLEPAWTGWPVHVITDDLSPAGRRLALATGPWGRCVYGAGSDVVDHQAVTMELESGASVVLVMHGHSGRESRTMRYDGSRATLRGRFGRDSAIEVVDHATGCAETIPIGVSEGGHGGGDVGVIRGFLAAVTSAGQPLTAAGDGLESHILAFAAERARVTGEVLDMTRFRAEARS